MPLRKKQVNEIAHRGLKKNNELLQTSEQACLAEDPRLNPRVNTAALHALSVTVTRLN